MSEKLNANPTVYSTTVAPRRTYALDELELDDEDLWDDGVWAEGHAGESGAAGSHAGRANGSAGAAEGGTDADSAGGAGVSVATAADCAAQRAAGGSLPARRRPRGPGSVSSSTSSGEGIDALEVFELIRHVNDPEHPLTLEQLNVACLDLVRVDNMQSTVDVTFTPTIQHCSMATLIGLCIRVKLLRCLPLRFKISVRITPGTHSSEAAVNKQLNDKERVAAAMENGHLLDVVNKCIARTDKVDDALAAM